MINAQEEDVQRRFASLELRVSTLEVGLRDNTIELRANTETTNSIKADTAQLVMMFKASKIGAEIVKWCATVGGAAIVAYAALRGITKR